MCSFVDYIIRFFKIYTLEVIFFIESFKIININIYNIFNCKLFLWWQSCIFSSLYSGLQSQMILMRWFGSMFEGIINVFTALHFFVGAMIHYYSTFWRMYSQKWQ